MVKKTIETHPRADLFVCEMPPLTLQEKEELKVRIERSIEKYYQENGEWRMGNFGTMKNDKWRMGNVTTNDLTALLLKK